ncbi:mechanosensitive ion channel family protein [Candidatus Halobeggiatoa sp. HSG11]|nr:mechanosensitive ion channel family protein [Candidatus Halobeggiatoa sp. HSG11]
MFEEYAVMILIFSIISILTIKILKNNNHKFRYSKLLWFVQTIFTVFILITGEIFLTDWLAETAYLSHLKTGFDILWWLIPAFLLNQAMELFIWTPLEERRTWQPILIPNIVRLFAAILIYAIATLGIIIFIYDSSIFALIILFIAVVIVGFFVKINFSSAIIYLERPLRIGDWVKIADFEEGEVVDITWRTVRIKTRDECIISIPSDVVLQALIKNFNYPDDVYWLDIKIKISDTHPQERVKKILLDALLSSNKILQEPAPVVLITDITNGIIEYSLNYCADDYSDKNFVKEDVFIRILHHLKQANISQVIESQPN